MSFVTTVPELLLAAAGQLQAIGSAVSAANGIAAFPTTGVIPAAADEVSAMTAASFSAYGQQYQAISAEAGMIHERFVDALRLGADSYATTEAANATQAAGGHVAPTSPLWHGGNYGGHAAPYGRGNYAAHAAPAVPAEHVAPVRPAPTMPAQHVAPARPAPTMPAQHVAPTQQVARADLAPTAAVQHVSPAQPLRFAPPEHKVALAAGDLAPTAAVQHVSPEQPLRFAPPLHRVALAAGALAPAAPVNPTPAISAVA